MNMAQRWLAIGETLRRLHLELAGDGLDCEQALKGASRVEGFLEHERWQTLQKLQRRYHDVLDRLELWDVQSARLVAIKQREITTDKDVVLIGAVDLNQSQRQMLDLIADRVTSLVIAPPVQGDAPAVSSAGVPPTTTVVRWVDLSVPLRGVRTRSLRTT